jgi:hypothetical protein
VLERRHQDGGGLVALRIGQRIEGDDIDQDMQLSL